MIRIGVLSDTHGHLDQPVIDFFSKCDEIWHAGDIGELEIMDILGENRVFRGVYGNIDDWTVRRTLPEFQEFTVEEVRVLITHIGMNYGKYTGEVVRRLNAFKPKIFVCGHSHILRIRHENDRNLLHINPGATGNHGIHQVRTAARFEIDGAVIRNMDVWEKERGPATRGKK